MNLCENGHDEVCYEGNGCPACAAISDLENTIADLNDKVAELEDRLKNE